MALLVVAAPGTGTAVGDPRGGFADHLFYSPQEDYRYRFPEETLRLPVRLVGGRVQLPDNTDLEGLARASLFLQVRLRASLLGRWFDPQVQLGDDRQTFERGVAGVRYLNLSGQNQLLVQGGMRVRGRFCQLDETGELFVFPTPAQAPQRTLILAPHADDAELAAFGLYSSLARTGEVVIVTLTQGEIEAGHYRRLGLSPAEAARLKGRLRAWDSRAIPLWAGVAPENCLQLGYYCLRLQEMRSAPDKAFASRESGEQDIRTVRRGNPLVLPGDRDGKATWRNLVADLAACLEHYRPQCILLPHPELDPHADHRATGLALQEALQQLDGQNAWQPEEFLLYVNHLHDNDRWPMGEAHTGVALPPALVDLPADTLHCHLLDAEQQLDKAMALAMQHDLQVPLSRKIRLRRLIQRILLRRRWPLTGEDEFMRKAVCRHELFWRRRNELFIHASGATQTGDD